MLYFKYVVLLAACIASGVVSGQVFEDMSEATGFKITGFNRGIAVGDFDNDGLEDIYVSRINAPNLLFRNLGNFQFEEVAGKYGLNSNKNTNCSLWFDVDNDRDLDLFLVNAFQANILFRNDLDTFIDVTQQYKVGTTANAKTAHAADYDNDGDLDLYVTNFLSENILWRNENGTTFSNFTAQTGISDPGRSLGAIFVDYDLDGDQDIFQTRDGDDPNLFFRNNGDGTFSEIGNHLGLDYVGFGMGTDVSDINIDGFPDIYLTNLEENRLYISNMDGGFDEISEAAGVDDIGMGWSTFFFDCNNDQLQDLYVANDSYFGVNGVSPIRNRMYVNLGNLTFYSPDTSVGVQNDFGTYGAAFADFDLDGKLDIAMSNHGVNDGNQIFRNVGATGNYIAFELNGSVSNTYGIGSRIQLYIEDHVQVDFVNAGSGYVSQNTARTHFGIGDATLIDSAVVYWPSGIKSVIVEPAINQVHQVIEKPLEIPDGVVVWTEPPFPVQTDDITVYFNAAEGNGALAGYQGDVYGHVGVITTESTQPNDWKFVIGDWGTADDRVLMTREQEDIYSLSYNIEEFHNLPPGTVVEQLAYVFRNVDGSIVGRATDGSDIYVDVYSGQGLSISVASPSNRTTILEGDSVLISVLASIPANITILDNAELIFFDSTDQVEFYQKPLETGNHTIEILAIAGDDTSSATVEYFVVADINELKEPPVDIRDGLNRTDSSYIFQLYAPGKQYAFLFTPANSYRFANDFQMHHSTDTGRFWIELPKGLFSEDDRTYQYYVDGNITIADPYSEVVLDQVNDQWLSPAELATMPPYPEDAEGWVTVFDLEKVDYNWQVNDFEKPARKGLVIYEVLIRDFLHDHSYTSLTDTLDYFKRLGVNAIELMPVNEFGGNISWGYNPQYHMAVDKYYGTREELKRFIDEAHKRGIAVILDVVFNHSFGQGPLVRLYWDAANSRPAADNPWLNPVPRHPFNVGLDFNHESQATKYWVKRNLEHWLEEFRFDGFRFDLSKGLTQKYSGNDVALMGRYDASRIAILKEYADYIWGIDSTAFVILEHFAENDEETELANYGMMLWGNMNHEFNEASMGYTSNLDWVEQWQSGWNERNYICYQESHDEERMMFRNLNYGDMSGDYSARDPQTALRRLEAANAVFYAIPGPKMLWQFGELGYEYSINRCPNGTISDDCRTDPKPIRWDYLNDPDRKRLFDITSALIHLKTTSPTFSTDDYDFDDGNLYVKRITLRHEDMDAFVVANFRVTESSIVLKYPYEGTWYDYITGDSIIVSDLNKRDTLAPGEYHVYTSKRISPPGGPITSARNPDVYHTIEAWPNPVSAGGSIFITRDDGEAVEDIRFSDASGKTVDVMAEQRYGFLELRLPNGLASGMYFIRLTTANAVYSGKVIVAGP